MKLMRNRIKTLYLSFRKDFLRIFLRRNESPLPQKIKKILIITPPRIGDVALVLKTLITIKNIYPEYEIHVCANDYTKGLLSLIIPEYQVHVAGRGIIRGYSLLKKFKNYSFDVSVDLNFDYHIKTATIAALAGKFSIGYDNSGRGYLFNRTLHEPDNSRHASDIFCEPLRLVFHDLNDPREGIINIPAFLKQRTQDRLNKIGISPTDKLILIHPGAHHWTQQWLPEYFAETADKIINAIEAKLIFIGGPREKDLIDKIMSLMKERPAGSFKNLDIKNLVGLIHRADLMICNNSGPLHIAVAINTPTVSTMGSTIMERWKPLGTIHKVLRIDNLACIGCNLGYCRIKTHDCMRLIKPSMIFEAVEGYFRSPGN